jgi:hypothetical protein
MNLGAALAAGGVALHSANNYMRQADEDKYRATNQDLAEQRARIVNEGLGLELEERTRATRDAAADRKTEEEFAALRGARVFGGAPPAAGGVPGGMTPAPTAPVAAGGIAPAGAVAPAGGVASAQGIPAKGKAPGAPPSEIEDYQALYQIAAKNKSTKGMRLAVEGVAQVAQAKFAKALEHAGAAFEMGDAGPLMNLYNERFPDGKKIVSLQPTADGGAIIQTANPSGKLNPPVTQTREQLQASLVRMTDKETWLKMTEEAFKQGQMTKREIAVQKQKGADDLAKQYVADAAAKDRNDSTIAGHVKTTGITAGATIKAAEIRANVDKGTAKEGAVQERIKVGYGVIDKALGANDMGGMTGENQALIGPAKRLIHKYLDQEMQPGVAAELALKEAKAEVAAGKMKVPVPAAAGPSASGAITPRW